jgi:hypothetical protein
VQQKLSIFRTVTSITGHYPFSMTSVAKQSNSLLPGHDIFHTPENSNFHSKKPYTELRTERKDIRLLHIHLDEDSCPIQCDLLQSIPLEEIKGQYAALSYCAGNPANVTAICVNGTNCNVFANLAHALKEARCFWMKTNRERPLLLWAD